MSMLFLAVRAAVYAALIFSFVLIAFPRWVVTRAGGALQEPTTWSMICGGILLAAGAALWLACVVAFFAIGRGTLLIFDPPRRLVARGPYTWMRNPMYVGAGVTILGAAVYYRSIGLALVALAFMLVTHLFVVLYEEPALTKKFGDEYREYLKSVPRWIPRLGS